MSYIDLPITEGYDDEDKLNLASKELEKQKKENFKRQLKEVDEIIAKNNKRVSKREYQNKIKELAQSDKETLSPRKKMERHIEKLEYNVTNYHNQAKAINLYPERRDAYWCNGCEHNWVSRNIAGKSHICPKCRGNDLDNINLSERKKEHQRLIHNHKVCKKQIKDFSKSLEFEK